MLTLHGSQRKAKSKTTARCSGGLRWSQGVLWISSFLLHLCSKKARPHSLWALVQAPALAAQDNPHPLLGKISLSNRCLPLNTQQCVTASLVLSFSLLSPLFFLFSLPPFRPFFRPVPLAHMKSSSQPLRQGEYLSFLVSKPCRSLVGMGLLH